MPLDTSLPKDDTDPKMSDEREFKRLVAARIGAAPDDWTGIREHLLAVCSAAGFRVPVGPINAGLLAFGGMKPDGVELLAAGGLNDDTHCGKLLYYQLPGAITLTVTPGALPATTVGNFFSCTILRLRNAGRITLDLDGSLTNQDPLGRRAVAEGGLALLLRVGNAIVLQGALEA